MAKLAAGWWASTSDFMVFQGLLSTADRQRVEGYLAWTRGLQSTLAGGHPYVSVPPSSGASISVSQTAGGTSQTVNIGGVASLNASHTDLGTSQTANLGAAASLNASHTDLGTSQVANLGAKAGLSGTRTDLGTARPPTSARLHRSAEPIPTSAPVR